MAKDKLHAVMNKIGYPDKWRDYPTLKIERAMRWAIRCARASSRLRATWPNR